jgi:predicted PurR-regulated permease PerM
MDEMEKQTLENSADKTQYELLAELLSEQKKSVRNSQICMILMGCTFALLLILAIIIVPRSMKTFTDIQTSMKKLQDFTDQAETEMKELDKLVTQAQDSLTGLDNLAADADSSLEGIDEMVQNINKLVVDNAEALDETISKMNEIDFDQLNQAIKDLANVIAPLASLFAG